MHRFFQMYGDLTLIMTIRFFVSTWPISAGRSKKSCGAPVYFHGGGRGLPDRGAGLRGGQGIDGTEGIAHFLPAGQKLVKDGGVGGGGTVEKDNGSWVDTAQELF